LAGGRGRLSRLFSADAFAAALGEAYAALGFQPGSGG
jgi:hypothetical protein